MRTIFVTVGALALGAAACGPGRTAAATQPTPAAFDPSKSDPKALELVDGAMTSLGGYAAWQAVKQLKFDVTYTLDGVLKGKRSHAWDRWNGRHHYTTLDLSTGGGDPAQASQIEVYYDLFDDGAPAHGSVDGKDVMHDDAVKFRTEAKKNLAEDGYMMTMIWKLRDPGVIVTLDGDLAEDPTGLCKGGCTRVKVTFDPAVGKDTWYVDYNNGTKLPELIEEQRAGEAGKIGYQIDGWNEAGGLKFPAKFENVGLKGEVLEFSNVEIGDPDDSLYVPSVTGAGGE